MTWSPTAWLDLGVQRWSLGEAVAGYLLAARVNPTERIDVTVGVPLPVLSVDTDALRRRIGGRGGGEDS